MFTGIVSGLGTVASVTADGDRYRLTVEGPYEDLELGESIAINGACLTVVEAGGKKFSVEAVATTRERTTIGDLEVGSRVNLERAVQVGDRFGGHFVQGHVDGVGQVVGRRAEADAILIDVRVPDHVLVGTVLHGSIALDGVSLTVNALPEPGVVQVSIIPYTAEGTTLGTLDVGSRVHVEGDMLGKFVQRWMEMRDGV